MMDPLRQWLDQKHRSPWELRAKKEQLLQQWEVMARRHNLLALAVAECERRKKEIDQKVINNL